MPKPTTTQAAYDVALRGLDHLLTIRHPIPHEISVIGWEIHGMDRLLFALGQDAASGALCKLGDQLHNLASLRMDDYHPHLATLKSELLEEATHV